MKNKYQTDPEAVKEAKKLEVGYETWFKQKLIDDTTPLVYLTAAISNQLNVEGSEGIFLGHAVNLLTQQPNEATLILERAGFNVKALPSVF